MDPARGGRGTKRNADVLADALVVEEDSHGDARPMIVRADWRATLRGHEGLMKVRAVINDERGSKVGDPKVVNDLLYAKKRYIAWGSVKLADSVVKASRPHPLHSHPYFFFVSCTVLDTMHTLYIQYSTVYLPYPALYYALYIYCVTAHALYIVYCVIQASYTVLY